MSQPRAIIKVGVVADTKNIKTGLQLLDELQEMVERRFWNSLHVIHSGDPDEPGARGGVSIAINKGLVDTKKVTCKPVIRGWVLLVEVPWNGDDTLRIMNVYALANNAEKLGFWEELLRRVEESEAGRSYG